MDEQNVPAVQLGRATQVDGLYARLGGGESLQSVLADPMPGTIILPVEWEHREGAEPGYTVELSTRGATGYAFFLRLIVEPSPNHYALIEFSQNQVNGPAGGFGGSLPRVDWSPNDWVRWLIQVWDAAVYYRAAKHGSLAQPFADGRPLQGIHAPYMIKAIVLGASDLDALSIAEVRIWDGQLFPTLEDQFEFFGGRRLDGRESRLLGYWKLAEGKGNRLTDSSRFGHDGTLNGGQWLDASQSGLGLDCSLELARQRREAVYAKCLDIRATKNQAAARRQELELLQGQIEPLKAEQSIIEQRVNKIHEDRDRELANLDKEFKEWQQRIQEGGKVGLDHFSESLAKEVDEASEALIKAKSAYQLQSVAFEAKMLPVQQKDKQDFLVTFPQADDKQIQPGQLSTLNLSFEPRPSPPPRTEETVPDVRGYTELVARRLLGQEGFQVEVLDQATDKPEEVDRVIDQLPQGGTRTGPDQGLHKPVTLFLGRAGGSGRT